MSAIRFAIIGCGMIAENHALAIAADPRAELRAAAYGTNRERGEKFKERFSVPVLVGDYRELLSRNDIDIVCICTPSGLHAEAAVAFANKGVSILCEKPLDISRKAVDDMINAAKDNNVRLGCVFPNRTRSGLKKAKQILDGGELGKIRIVECQYRGYRSHAYYNSSKWKGTRALDGGGCLMNQGIHAIDTMLWLAGKVKSVCAQVGALGRDIEVEDTAAALLEFEDNAQGVLMGTTLSYMPEDAPEGDRIRIECENGSILYANGRTTLFKSNNPEDFDVARVSLDEDICESESSGARPENIDMKAHSEIVSNMVAAVLDNAPVLVPAESARQSVDLILAIYESSANRKWVNIY